MSMLGRIHGVGATTIAVGYALYRIALGSLMIVVCAWLFAKSGKLIGELLVLAAVGIWGLVIVVKALGPFAGTPSPDRAAKRETRKALRRARMLRRWL